jgi:fibronectin-binding autotransporter adhesin
MTMKTRYKSPKTIAVLAALCSAVVTMAAFGQTVQIWTGGNGTGTAIGNGTNWLSGTSPNSANGDICQWDSTVPGNLFLTATSPNGGFNNGTPGVSFYVAASHTGSWNLSPLINGTQNIALNNITNDSGTGPWSLGDGTANVLNLILRPSSSSAPPNSPIHVWQNNSANAATIYPNTRWQSGGGNPHVVQIDGTGDWIVNDTLCMANGPATFFVKTGSGGWFWSANSIAGAAPTGVVGSPMDIEGGRLVITATSSLLGTQRVTNNATFQYAVNAPLTWSGPFDGTNCTIVVSAGTLTLSSTSSDFDGHIVLTNGGVLNVGGNQNVGGTGPLGTNGPISFNGGTLQFSVANTFDYSPRFDTAAGQAYSIDTQNQNVTLTNALTSSGGTLTKLGSGMLTLTGANTYSGNTTISAGKLEIQGSQSSGNITVGNSTTLGVTELGPQITPATLTVGTSSGATLEFNNVSSESTPPIAAGTVSAPAGSPITVNVASGSFLINHHYPLFSFTGTPPAVTLGTLVGAVGNLSTNGNTIQLNVTSLAFVWSGLNNANWDTTTPNNWKVNGVAQTWTDGGAALLDDTVTTANTNVTLNSAVSPAGTTVNNSVKPYSITSSGTSVIGGTGGLTKNGNSILTLAGGLNNYSGATTINAGTVSVGVLANGGSVSDIGASGNSAANLVLNGGTLLYTGAAQDSDRRFTLGTAGGTISSSGSGALTLTNSGAVALSGTGARTLTLRGTDADDNILAASLGDNGGATALTKADAGKWIVTGNNTNSGTVAIAGGILQVGVGDANGSLGTGNISDNGTLIFNTTSTLTNGTVTGTGAVDLEGTGTVILPGNNNYTGATTINAGTLQIGNGGASGTLSGGGAVTDNGTLIYDSTSTINVGGLFGAGIGGSGNVIVRKGTFQALGNNTYSGWTEIDPGATFQPSFGNAGSLLSSVVTNNGTLLVTRQDTGVFFFNQSIVGSGSLWKISNNGNFGDVTLTAANTYTGGTVIIGGAVVLADGGSIVGNVALTNDYVHNQFGTPPNDFVPATLTFNHSDDVVFPGNIVGNGFLVQQGGGVLTLTGNNTYTNNGTGANTTISAGTLQIGNGGTTGSIGFGPVADNSAIVFNRSDAVTIANAISGGGSLVQTGSGTLTLAATNTYTGSTTVSNGTLVITGGSVGGDVNVEGGTLIPAAAGTVGALAAGNVNIDSGAVSFALNKSLSPSSNTVITVAGSINATGGSVKLVNVGPQLAAGDKFTLFSAAVVGGSVLTITGANTAWQNNLELDGSITAVTVTNTVTVNTNPPALRVVVSGGTLSLAWPTNLGWTLQTNSVGLTAANQWFTYPGSASMTNVDITVNPAKTNVFFRMVYTNTP